MSFCEFAALGSWAFGRALHTHTHHTHTEHREASFLLFLNSFSAIKRNEPTVGVLRAVMTISCDDVRVQVAQSDSSASATARAASGEGCVSLVATMKKKQKVTRNASRKETIRRL
jgi:hypothetical protein